MKCKIWGESKNGKNGSHMLITIPVGNNLLISTFCSFQNISLPSTISFILNVRQACQLVQNQYPCFHPIFLCYYFPSIFNVGFLQYCKVNLAFKKRSTLYLWDVPFHSFLTGTIISRATILSYCIWILILSIQLKVLYMHITKLPKSEN